jgi:hypothetical protein
MKSFPWILFAAVSAAAALAAWTARGDIISAPTCSDEDVQAAIDAAADGDTVLVPAGSCTWDAAVVLDDKSVILRGEGMDVTVITDATSDAWAQEPLWIDGSSGKSFRVTGFTFKGMQRRGSTEPAINVRGSWIGWRIDHCKFDSSDMEPGTQGRGVSVCCQGVIDHCVFLNSYTAVTIMGDGDASWERPLALGGAEMVFVEDNRMENTDVVGDGATDAYGGARYVFRYNTVINARAGHHGFDSGGYRSPHSFEIYHNTFTWSVDNSWYTARYRGGTGVVFDNVLEGTMSETLTFGVVNYRTCCCNYCTGVEPPDYGYPCDPFTACADPLHTNCSEWGRCDGLNPLDGNLDATGYPCRDQVGRSTDMDDDGIQDLEPLYAWGNTANDMPAIVTTNDPWGCADPSMDDHLQDGRDYINGTPRPGYEPYPYPHPLTTAESTCSELGGVCCSAGQICDGGLFQSSSDCGELCCTEGACADAESFPDEPPDGADEAPDAAADSYDAVDASPEEGDGGGDSGCGCSLVL